MKYFVDSQSIVRQIWGKSETIIFIFAGASAEFALNKAVDWLFFTGRLPADPLGRLFSTVSYAQKIVFSEESVALKMIHQINTIHHQVEENRNATIPDWAYRDVLYMLIDYSISSYELLERPLLQAEKEEVFSVFYKMGLEMQLKNLPNSYSLWLEDRIVHMQNDLSNSDLSKKLFAQYQKHLGSVRYELLLEAQKLVVPNHVRNLLNWSKIQILKPAVHIYKIFGEGKLQDFIKSVVLPVKYKEEIKGLDSFKTF